MYSDFQERSSSSCISIQFNEYIRRRTFLDEADDSGSIIQIDVQLCGICLFPLGDWAF